MKLKKHWPKPSKPAYDPPLLPGQRPRDEQRTDLLRVATTPVLSHGVYVNGAKQFHAAPIDSRYTGYLQAKLDLDRNPGVVRFKTGEFCI
jgi:hypothetical protein